MKNEMRSNVIQKAAQVTGAAVTEQDLAKINELSIRELTADEVFVFRVAMCDNEIDRVFEVFPTKTLRELAKLYKGKTVIADHAWKSENQVARIFDTEVVEEPGRNTGNGETYAQLVARCYMLRTESNKDLIAEIEAGIKKEVSVGCSIKSVVCSICGADNRQVLCRHVNGREYDGKLCYFKLLGAGDAYEISFVAVPAQREAGVIKSYGGVAQEYEPAADPTTGKQIHQEPELEPDDGSSEKTTTEADVRIKIAHAFLFTHKHKEEIKE